MKRLLPLWYRFSLPKRTPDTTPVERERTRYARLTSAFILLLLVSSILLLPLSTFHAFNPVAATIAFVSLAILLLSVVFSKLGWNIVAASLLILNTIIQVSSTMLTNKLDPSLIPIFDVLVVSVILAGALMPPFAALVTGGVNSAIIILVSLFQAHTPYYDSMAKLGSYSVTLIALPVAIQIIVAIITFVILRNLQTTIQRADRAEEIVALQREVSQHERARLKDQQQLAEGIEVIAQVHASIAKGDLEARVPLQAENVLWQIAVPLNNLLNRVQRWKSNADQFERTQQAIHQVVTEIQRARTQHTPLQLPPRTGTPLDRLLLEINRKPDDAQSPQYSQH